MEWVNNGWFTSRFEIGKQNVPTCAKWGGNQEFVQIISEIIQSANQLSLRISEVAILH